MAPSPSAALAVGVAVRPDQGDGAPGLQPEAVPSAALPWYGTAAVQFTAIALCALAFASGGLVWPIVYSVRRLKGRSLRDGRRLRWIGPLASVGSLLSLALLVSLVGALFQFLMADEGALRQYLELPFLRTAVVAAPLSAVAWAIYAVQGRSRRAAMLARSAGALAAVALTLDLLYWNLPW